MNARRPGPPWSDLRTRPEPSDAHHPRSRKARDEDAVLRALAHHHPALLVGTPGAVLSADDAIRLREALRKDAPAHAFRRRVAFLNRGLEAGAVTLGWTVTPLSPSVAIAMEPSPFTPDAFAARSALAPVERALLADLAAVSPPTPKAAFGRILLSAVLFGALLEPPLWPSLWTAARRPLGDAEALGLDLTRRERGGAAVLRRWFPDPLTLALLWRWRAEVPAAVASDHPPASPWICLRAYLEERGVMPPDRDAFLEGAAARWHLRMPGFLVGYALGVVRSASLPATAWWRIRRDQAITVAGEHATETEPRRRDDEGHPAADMVSASIAAQTPVLRRLRVGLRETGGAAARRAVEAALAGVPLTPAMAHVGQYALDLLTTRTRATVFRQKAALRPVSIQRYLQAFAKPLVALAGSEDFSLWDPDDVAAFYQRVIDAAGVATLRADAAQALRRFHAFLVESAGAEPVDFTDLLGEATGGLSRVDANLVAPADIARAVGLLTPDPARADRSSRMRVLILTLGYRAGLRRSEALHLRLRDLHPHADTLTLRVRPSRYAQLKSEAAVRRLPLHVLMSREEVAALRAWGESRRREDLDTDVDALLFCHFGCSHQPLDPAEIFPPIHDALRRVTGDATVRFHTLRHSFASLTLLRLLRPIWAPTIDHAPIRSAVLNDPSVSAEACARLAAVVSPGDPTGLGALHALSTLCGHADVATTLHHYVHVCDLLVGCRVWHPDAQPQPPLAVLSAMAGLSDDHLSRVRRDEAGTLTLGHVWAAVRRRWAPSETAAAPGPVVRRPRVPVAPPSASESFPPWRVVMAAVRDVRLEGESATGVAKRLGVPLAAVERWLAVAREIFDRRTPAGRRRHASSDPIRRKDRIPDFFPPRRHVDLALVDRLVTRGLDTRGTRRALMTWGVGMLIERYDPRTHDIPLASREEEARFDRFLRILGVPESRILRRGAPWAERRAIAGTAGSDRSSDALRFAVYVLAMMLTVTRAGAGSEAPQG